MQRCWLAELWLRRSDGNGQNSADLLGKTVMLGCMYGYQYFGLYVMVTDVKATVLAHTCNTIADNHLSCRLLCEIVFT